MPGFLVVPPQAFAPGGLLNPAREPFWGLNEAGVSCNEAPLYFSDPWDTFYVNDVQLPGKCWVDRGDLAQIEIERTKGKGNRGAKLKIYGYEPHSFDVVIQITTDEQWQVYQSVQDRFWAGPTKTMKPPQGSVRVRYPDLGRLRVYSAVLFMLPPAEPADVPDGKNFRWRFHEDVPQAPIAAKVASGPIPEDPRLPSSTGPVNQPAELPSKNPGNTGLQGPQLNTRGGGTP